MTVPTRVVVLVEGHSDAVALRVLCDRAGVALGDGRVEIRNMHGVTNVARQLSQLDQHHLPRRHPGVGVRVLGLCDAPERRFVARALRARGVALESDDELSRWGFEVCDRDLEDELVRALGPGAEPVPLARLVAEIEHSVGPR